MGTSWGFRQADKEAVKVLFVSLLLLGPALPGATPRASAPAETGPLGIQRSDDAAEATVSLRMEQGKSEVVTKDGVAMLLVGQPARNVRGLGHCELGRASVVSARWSGIGSARIQGKASFGVGTRAGRPEISFHFLRTADLELRRGKLDVELPNGWSFTQGRAAIGLVERVDGRIELLHRGGVDLVLVGPPRRDRYNRPVEPQRVRIASGQRVLLPAQTVAAE